MIITAAFVFRADFSGTVCFSGLCSPFLPLPLNSVKPLLLTEPYKGVKIGDAMGNLNEERPHCKGKLVDENTTETRGREILRIALESTENLTGSSCGPHWSPPRNTTSDL